MERKFRIMPVRFLVGQPTLNVRKGGETVNPLEVVLEIVATAARIVAKAIRQK